VRDAMTSSQTGRSRSWSGYDFLREALGPYRLGPGEVDFFWRLLADGSEPHQEVFSLLRDSEIRQNFFDQQDERDVMRKVRARMSPLLGERCDAIEAYERVCRPLQEAFDLLRFISTGRGAALIGPQDVAAEPRLAEIVRELPENISRARSALSESPIGASFDKLAEKFQEVRSPEDLFRALWEHHYQIQKRKPPEGKRPWFEQTSDGGLIVRPPYRLEKFKKRERYVHPYRLSSVIYFLNDLFGSN